MAVPSFSVLTSNGSGADQTSYATASITPAANAMLYLVVWAVTPSAPASAVPTISGGGVSTWTEIPNTTVTNENRRLTWFMAATGSSPGSGAITISFGAVTQDIIKWKVVQALDVLLTGTNGADSVRQADTFSASAVSTFTCTLPGAWGHSDNRALGAGFVNVNAATLTPGTGFTELVASTTSNGTLRMLTGRDADTLDIDGTWSTGGRLMASAFEVVGEADAASTPITFQYTTVRSVGLNGGMN